MTTKQLQMLTAVNKPMPHWRDDRNWLPSECFATRNKVLHLPSYVSGWGQYSTQATPDYVSTSATDYPFVVENPGCPNWINFIKSITLDDESRRALQMWAGYCLTPGIEQEKILFLLGETRSGKGIYSRVLSSLVGSRNVAGPTLAGLATNFGLAGLIGRSLAIIGDARLSARADQSTITERLLSLSSGDRLDIDRKYAESLNIRLPIKIMILSNELPRLSDASNALADRMIIVRTAQSFLGREDTGLEARLLTELPGILHWAIEGWAMLRDAKRLIQPNSGSQDMAQIKRLSSPLSAFIDDECELAPGLSIEARELFKRWQNWCLEANHHPGSRETFGRDLQAAAKVERKRRTDNGRPWEYRGITWAGVEKKEPLKEPAELFPVTGDSVPALS